MKKKRFTEQQIIGFLKEAAAGMPVKELGEPQEGLSAVPRGSAKRAQAPPPEGREGRSPGTEHTGQAQRDLEPRFRDGMRWPAGVASSA